MRYKGKNRAVFEKSAYKSFTESVEPVTRNICIFLSHIRIDKKATIEIGNYIINAGFDIYLDIYDDDLQQAVAENNAKKITDFLETGIDNSTHILCLVSEQTVHSWWVPYEIGFGKKGEKEIVTLTLKDTVSLPSYLSIGKLLRGTKSLNIYLQEILKSNDITESLYKSSSLNDCYLLLSTNTNHPLDPYLNWKL